MLHKAQQIYLLQSLKLCCLKLCSNSAGPGQGLQDPQSSRWDNQLELGPHRGSCRDPAAPRAFHTWRSRKKSQERKALEGLWLVCCVQLPCLPVLPIIVTSFEAVHLYYLVFQVPLTKDKIEWIFHPPNKRTLSSLESLESLQMCKKAASIWIHHTQAPIHTFMQ